MTGAHVEFGIPGVVGGVVRVPLKDDAGELREDVIRALKVAQFVQEKWQGTFPQPVRDPANEREEPRSGPPKCSKHGSAMKAARNGGWFCPRKVGDGYCEEKVDG